MENQWLTPFHSLWDVIGFIIYIAIFPIYHSVYPLIAIRRPDKTARGVTDELRKSWIEGLIARGDIVLAAQQTRNLTMVNSILVSSALILIGLTANLLVQLPNVENKLPHPEAWEIHPGALRVKLLMLIVVFASAFSFCMTALRHLGQFVLVIGADPKLVEKRFGSAATYFSDLINRASHRYTIGVRSFHAAFPLLAWLFDSRLFVILTVFWALKFLFFQDFDAGRRSKRT